MADSTRDSDAILRAARSSLQVQREGGYHRRSGSIGEGSRRLKRQNVAKRLKGLMFAVLAILAGATVTGMVLDGIGFVGVMLLMAAIVSSVLIFGLGFKTRPPKRADLKRTQDAGQLVARTELWLEHQRAALPAPAAKIVGDMGVQLDALGKQLAHVDPAHPAAGEVRSLVGEILPETIDSYRRIPDHLRREERGGSTPDAQLTESLTKISREIDHVTRQLAEGSLDDLAVRTRYLDYKYGNAEEVADVDAGTPLGSEGSGVPLPEFDRERSSS